MKTKFLSKNFRCFVICFSTLIMLLCGGMSAFGAIDSPVSVDLQEGSDSGVYSDDNLTNIPTHTIDITAAEEGNTINVYREDVLLCQAVFVSGVHYQYTFTEGQLTEGINAVTARSFDGVEESLDSPSLEIELDVSGPRIIDREPRGAINIHSVTLDSVTVGFNEAIYFQAGGGSLTFADVAFNGPDGDIVVSDITSLGNNEYEISFAAQTSLGFYVVTVGPDITDMAGNMMDQDQDGIVGEADEDAFVASFFLDEGERSLWEGLEDSHPEWEIENGVWQVGEPSSGPSTCSSGPHYAATVLDGKFPGDTGVIQYPQRLVAYAS
jgi:hypothetical protein